MFSKIYYVASYSDGVLAAYDTEEDALEAMSTYNDSGLYPNDDTYVEECFYFKNN